MNIADDIVECLSAGAHKMEAMSFAGTCSWEPCNGSPSVHEQPADALHASRQQRSYPHPRWRPHRAACRPRWSSAARPARAWRYGIGRAS